MIWLILLYIAPVAILLVATIVVRSLVGEIDPRTYLAVLAPIYNLYLLYLLFYLIGYYIIKVNK